MRIEGMFTEKDTGDTIEDDKSLTVVRVELTPTKHAPANPDSCDHRHELGVFEKVFLASTPEELPVAWSIVGGGANGTSEEGYVGRDWDIENMGWLLRCPLYSKSIGLKASCLGVELPVPVTIREPMSLRHVPPTYFEPFPRGVSAAGMRVPQYLLPDTVNFQEISIQEIPVENEHPNNSGYFASLPLYFQTHTSIAGAGLWSTPDNSGCFGEDRPVCEAGINPAPGWQRLRLPWGWHKEVAQYLSKEDDDVVAIEYFGRERYSGGSCFREITQRYDSYDQIFDDGSVLVSRFGYDCLRTTNGVYFLNGVQVGD